MTDKLKPCPFCGGEAVLRIVEPHTHYIVDMPDYGGGAFVECTECTCGVSAETEQAAVKVWNIRKPMDRIVEQLEEQKKLNVELWESASWMPDKTMYGNKAKGYEEAIEIVKGGAE